MINYNEDYEYAAQRLPQTVVRMADTGMPVYVHEVRVREKKVSVSSLEKGVQENKLVKLKDLILDSPPLGFVNYNGVAVFVMRIPMRRDWRQGVRMQNCYVCSQGLPIHFNDLLRNDALHNCIIGKYPTISRILDKYNAKAANLFAPAASLAWDRHWALTPQKGVMYKDWGVVGTLLGKGDDIMFKDGHAFLRENFEESVR